MRLVNIDGREAGIFSEGGENLNEFPFSELQINQIVAIEKFTPINPEMYLHGGAFRMSAAIFLDPSCRKDIKLRICAEISQNSDGSSRLTPTCVLLYFNRRIRGINRHIRYRNPDGQEIRGWHEHYWTDENEERQVNPIFFDDSTLDGLFTFGLQRWNIKVVTERTPSLFGE